MKILGIHYLVWYAFFFTKFKEVGCAFFHYHGGYTFFSLTSRGYICTFLPTSRGYALINQVHGGYPFFYTNFMGDMIKGLARYNTRSQNSELFI